MKEKKVFLLTLIPEAAPPHQWPAKDKKSGDNIFKSNIIGQEPTQIKTPKGDSLG
jgi:hypothetical protein